LGASTGASVRSSTTDVSVTPTCTVVMLKFISSIGSASFCFSTLIVTTLSSLPTTMLVSSAPSSALLPLAPLLLSLPL
jgi:hypothetical protein